MKDRQVFLRHLGVDLSLVWNIVERDLDALEDAVGQLIVEKDSGKT